MLLPPQDDNFIINDINPNPNHCPVDTQIQQQHNIKCLKIWIFFLTAFAFSTMHTCRTVWSYAKPTLAEDPYYNDQFLGTLDMTFLLFYATGLYVNGWLGDQINLRIFLSVGMLITVLAFGWISLIGLTNTHNKGFLSVAFAINGLGQSTV